MKETLWFLLLLFIASAVGGLVVLALSLVSVETEVEGPEGHWVTYEENPPSLDLQIFDSDVIVKATFVSATPSSESRNTLWAGSIHIPVQHLRFRSQEYLKGTGPAEFIVEVKSPEANGWDGYSTSAEAVAAARELIAERDTTYDSRAAILFLNGPLTEASGAGGVSGQSTSTTYGFTETNMNRVSWDYSVSSGQRLWMPAQSADSGATGSSGGQSASESSQSEFIVDSSTDPDTIVTLADLKAKISALATRLSDNAHIEGYARCVRSELGRERALRGKERIIRNYTIPSGTAPELAILSSLTVRYGDTEYRKYATSGSDASYFHTVIVDDDDDPSRYVEEDRPIRPLPEGSFEVSFKVQIPADFPCDHFPDDYPLSMVTVTAPAGTVYEAFFDITVGAAGTPLPSEFSVGGKSTSIQLLDWDNGEVFLLLYPYVSLSGHALDFIALDGSVSLSLEVDNASVDAANSTLSWTVASQPWEDGDLLMLRIREES